MDKKDEQNFREMSSLESPGTTVEPVSGKSAAAASGEAEPAKPETQKSHVPLLLRLKNTLKRFNIYLLLFVLLLLVTGLVGLIAYRAAHNSNETGQTSQTLNPATLKDLQNKDVSVGDAKQTLTIASNSVFGGKVLIRNDLEVAGQIKVGGPLNLPGISVSGTSSFDKVQISNLVISGNTQIQGQASIQKDLTVSGSASIAGTLSAGTFNLSNLKITSDLQVGQHIDPTGDVPSKTDGGSLGSGGTVSVSGTDTAGTITVNTGGSPAAGCFVTLTFVHKFNATPHVILSASNQAAGGLNYYSNRSTTNFTACTANAPVGGTTYIFDYVVLD